MCSQIVLKSLYLARICRPHVLWSVNKLARAVTKWTQACDRRLARLISYIHHTSEFKQYCHVENRTRILLETLRTPNSLGRISCISGSRTCVPISWLCKKQTSVSHSSTESEVISLDAGLRMDGLRALDLWNVMMEEEHSSKNTEWPTQETAGNRLRKSNTKPKNKGNRDVDELSNVDHVVTNANSSQSDSQLYIFEDNEAVIKMINGKSPTMRHVSATHRVALDGLTESTWSPESKSNMLTPSTNSRTR